MSTDGHTDSGRVLRELSAGRLKDFRKPLAPASSSQQNRASSPSSGNDLPTVSSIDPNDENLMMSTRHNFDDDSHLLPKLRSTAQNYRFFNPPETQQHVPSSAVNRAFQDFDVEDSSDDNSIEVGRGVGRNTRGTPSKLGTSDIIMQLGDSFYEVNATPKSHRARKANVPERNSLRRDTLRRASGIASKEVDTAAKSSPHASRPTTGGSGSTKSTRLYSARKDTGDTTGYGRATSEPPPDQFDTLTATLKRPMAGTPRSAGHVNNPTGHSFVLPDVSNLTELLGGTAEIRQVATRSAKARSRFASGTPRRGASQPNYVPIEQVPVPEDEQVMAKALEVLKEKVSELEKYKDVADSKMADYENQIIELRAELEEQQNLRKTDSALGGSDDEGNMKSKWRIEKSRLETAVTTLQNRVERAERKLSTTETTLKRVTQEREAAVAQFGVSSHHAQELEEENARLQDEIATLSAQAKGLRAENKKLRIENDNLRAQLDNTHDRHEVDTQRWTRKEAELNRKAAMTDRAVALENDELRARVDELEDALDEQTQQLPRLEAQAYRKAEKEAKAQQTKLRDEALRLDEELAEAKSVRDQELKRWTQRESELKSQISRKDQAIQGLKDQEHLETADHDLMREIKRLRAELKREKARRVDVDEPTIHEVDLQDELDRVIAQHQEDSQRWKAREAQLRDMLQRMTTREFSTKSGRIGATLTGPSRNVRQDAPTARSRSKSGVLLPHRSEKLADADVAAEEGPMEVSDAESTTDLDLGHLRREKQRRLSSKSDLSRRTASEAHGEVSVTHLSFSQTDNIADLRQHLDNERLAKQQRKAERQRRTVSASEPLQHNATIKKKSSVRDLTSQSLASAPMDLEEEYEHTIPDPSDAEGDAVDTKRSNNSARPRRSVSAEFKEMTSAFIIPDITLPNASKATQAALHNGGEALVTPHDTKSCSICQRVLSTQSRDAAAEISVKLSSIIPVSAREHLRSDPDATMRPTQPPLSALCAVLKALYDERAHYHLQLQFAQQELQALDPAAERRKHNALHARIAKLNSMLDAKSAQIYALFDVVEAHRAELGEHGDEAEAEQLEEVSQVIDELRKGKKVGFRDAAHQPTVEDEAESDAPWEGISVTGEVPRR